MLNGYCAIEVSKSAIVIINYFICHHSCKLVGCMLLVSRSRLVEEDAVEVFYYYGFHLSINKNK